MTTGADTKKLVRDMIERVWIGGDLDELPAFWTEDCVNHAAPGDPVGLQKLRAYHESFAAALSGFADVAISVVQQIAEDDRVVTHLATTGRHTGDFQGIPATGRDATLVTVRIDRVQGGRIAEHWSVADVAGLVQQLRTT